MTDDARGGRTKTAASSREAKEREAKEGGSSGVDARESRDVVLLGPPTADGAGVHVLRAREERIEAGELRALEEGKPVSGEVVTLAPRRDNPRVCDVKDSYDATPRSHKGPARVATQRYRDGWDEIFGAKAPARAGDRDVAKNLN